MRMVIGALIACVGLSAQARDLERAAPDSVGLSQAGLAKLKGDMQALVDKGDRAGIVYAVARKGKLVAFETLGKRSVERDLPMTADTQFRLYSMSRAVTAAAILTLVDEGKLRLDDPVSKYIPAFGNMPVIKAVNGESITTEPQRTPMTVFHLFTYTSGLGYGNDWPASLGMTQRDILDLNGTIADSMTKLAKYPLLSQPGAKWHYGFSSDVLGRIAEIASGETLDQFLRKRLLDKIGMPGTGFTVRAGKADLLADVYGPDAATGKLGNVTAKAPPSSSYLTPGTFFSAGGGLISTANDYIRFCQMLLNGGQLDGVRVLKAETVKNMLTRHTTPEQGLVYWYESKPQTVFKGYGWGLAIGARAEEAPHDVPGSPGDAAWGGLANTQFFVDPKEDLAAVAMSQYLGPDEPTLGLTLRKDVYAALGRK